MTTTITNAIAQTRVLLRALVTVEVYLARAGAEEIRHVLSKKHLDSGEVRFSLKGSDHALTVTAHGFDDDFYITVTDNTVGAAPPDDPIERFAREAGELVQRVHCGQERLALCFELTQTGPVDALGRRHFTLAWVDPDGRWESKPHPQDGHPVGYRHGQELHAVPEECVKRLEARGHVVQVFEDITERPARARKAGRR